MGFRFLSRSLSQTWRDKKKTKRGERKTEANMKGKKRSNARKKQAV